VNVTTLRAAQYLIIVALWLAGVALAARRTPALETAPIERASLWKVTVLAFLLVAETLVEFAIVEVAALQQLPFPARFSGLPLVPIDDSAPLFGHTASWIGESVASLAVAQSLTLALLFRALHARTASRAALFVLGGATCIMLGAALRTHALGSSDLYLYVGHARLGAQAYAPPPVRFEGEFGAINDVRGVPIYPALYGPVWLALGQVIAAGATSLAGQLQAFRVFGALSFGACIVLLAALRRSPAIVALFGLNPALIEQYVANGHNDLFPLALVLAALALVPRRAWLGWALVVAAGAAKLPFAVAGLVAFVPLAGRGRRFAFAASAVLAAVGVTYAASGGMYFRTSQHMAARITSDAITKGAHDVAIALALVAVLVALAYRCFIPTASWSFLSLSTVLFPWYAVWGLPYALVEDTLLPFFLGSLPVVTFLLASVYAPTPLSVALYLLAAVAAPALALRAFRVARAGR